MQLNGFQKNFVFTLISLSILGSIGGAGYMVKTNIAERREQARLTDAKKRVERVMKLNVCAHLTDGERARLDKVLLDPFETKKILIEIHNERKNTWDSRYEQAKRNMARYSELHRTSPSYISYIPEFNSAKEDAVKAIEEKSGFDFAIKLLEAHNVNEPFEDEKKSSPKV